MNEHFPPINLINSRSKMLKVFIEPWGSDMALDPGETLTLSVTEPGDDYMEIELTERGVIIYAAHDSVVKVFQGDTLVLEGAKFPKPPLGKSTRDFITDLFGKNTD